MAIVLINSTHVVVGESESPQYYIAKVIITNNLNLSKQIDIFWPRVSPLNQKIQTRGSNL